MLLEFTEAKGHRRRSGLKFPRTKTGMGRGMGLGMGMGMGMPIFIPVVIPMGGYGRHRNSYRYGNTNDYPFQHQDINLCFF